MTSLVYGGKPGAFSGWRGDHHDTSMDEWGQDDSLLGEAVTFDMLYPDLNGMSDLSLNSAQRSHGPHVRPKPSALNSTYVADTNANFELSNNVYISQAGAASGKGSNTPVYSLNSNAPLLI